MMHKAISQTSKAWKPRLGRLLHGEHGGLLMEVSVSLAAFGLVGLMVLTSIQVGSAGRRLFDVHSTSENVVRNQMESILEQSYKSPTDLDPTYTPIVAPSGFTVTAESLTYDVTSDDISTVRITVYHQGQPVKVFETVRANR